MLTVTKIAEFHYAHYLPDYDGCCSKMHGHTGIIEVEVRYSSVIDDKNLSTYNGFIIDFSDLKEIIQQEVIDEFDHALLNDVLNETPTAENMVQYAVHKLYKKLGSSLIRVRIYETSTSYAEWKMESVN